MLKKMLCAVLAVLMMAVSSAEAVYLGSDAVAYIKAGAESGDAFLQDALGLCYNEGTCEGIPQDRAKAREWYEKAATQGFAKAQVQLGCMYSSGQGVRQDFGKALNLFEKAAAQGDADACYFLGGMYFSGHGVRQDYAKAREWYEKSSSQGIAEAQILLGMMYDEGLGVQQNKATAKEYYGKACDNGNQEGCDEYRRLNMEDNKKLFSQPDTDGREIYKVYATLVQKAVLPNWKMPVKHNTKLTVQVRISQDRDGIVQDCRIERSSGNYVFDSSVIDAVYKTNQLPKPPTPAQQDFLINFSSTDVIK